MHAATPILLLTHDDFLWKHWRTLDDQRWLLARGNNLTDLQRWQQQGRTLAVIDTGLPELPDWSSPLWQPLVRNMNIVIASVRPSDDEGAQAIAAGLHGYCHAYAPALTLTRILDSVSAGSVWMGASLVSRLLQQVHARTPSALSWRHTALTEREHAIALLVAKGEPNLRIATAMGISERTVKAHLTSIFEKLNIDDRLQLALLVHGIQS